MLFNSFGFRYFGPIDGHNLSEVEYALEKAKDQDSPVVIHALTTKGKGYQFAEEDPVKWHGVTPFNIEQGEIFTKKVPPSYTSIFADTLIDICKNNKKVVGITAAMPEGTGLSKLAKECPEQFYDVAIAEQHGVTFAAGLCCEGIKPVVAIYSTFLQRAFDQIVHDVCIQNLPVMFALDRAGLVGADGPTHHGVFDLSYLRCLPNMVISAPKDEYELIDLMHTGVEYNDSPFAVRYPRANCKSETLAYQPKKIEIGRGEIIKSGTEVALLGLGITVGFCEDAAKILENSGIFPTIINARFVKPLDSELILKIAGEHKLIFTVEDQTVIGGFGSAVCELLADKGLSTKVLRLGVPDRFIDHGTQAELYSDCGFDAKSIAVAVLNQLRSI